jgi:hypothetical protein
LSRLSIGSAWRTLESGRGGADQLRRAVVADEMGELRLQLGVAADERVIFGVADLRRVVGMVEPVVAGDLGRESLKLGGGFLLAVGHERRARG